MEPTSREGVAAHTAKFDDDVTVRNNARLYGDDRERALGERVGTGQPGAEREKKKPPGRDVSTQRQKARTRVTNCNGKDRPARVRGGSAHNGQGRLGAEREKKKSPRRDISTQRQKARTQVTDCNGKDRPARVRGGSAHSRQGRPGAEREKKKIPWEGRQHTETESENLGH